MQFTLDEFKRISHILSKDLKSAYEFEQKVQVLKIPLERLLKMFDTKLHTLDYVNLNFDGPKIIDFFADLMQNTVTRHESDETKYRLIVFRRNAHEMHKFIKDLGEKHSNCRIIKN